MKKILLFAFAVAAMASCKNERHSPIQQDGEILLSSSTKAKGVVVDYEKDSRNNFFEGDEIGIFQINQTAAVTAPHTFDPTVTGKQERVNVGYKYGEPFWKAVDLTSTSATDVVGRIKFPTNNDKVAKLFAYFPYILTDKAPIANDFEYVKIDNTTEANVPVITFALPVEQSNDKTLRAADLMYAQSQGADANNTGWALSSAPVTLEFKHLLTKMSFDILIKNSAIVTPAVKPVAVTRFIRAIEVNGKNIIVGSSTLEIETGTLTTTKVAEEEVLGSVWCKYLAEDKGLEVATGVEGALTAAADVTANRIDLLLYPFVQLNDENEIAIYLTTTNAEISDLDAAVAAGEVERYIISIAAPDVISGSIANTSKWHFTSGRANKFTAQIDVATKSINVITTITEWTGNTEHTVPAE